MAASDSEPLHDCKLCPRLADYRDGWRKKEATWFNAPVPSFGPRHARVLIVGLAPGLQGANRTGRPFTGDYAGVLLYDTLTRYRFARGTYEAHPDDDLELTDCRITNAVRCVPPENKPTTQEIATCRPFLAATIAEMKTLAAIVPLGRIAHDTVLATLGVPRAQYPFAHGAKHTFNGLSVFDSYHCSRYNTNTGVLTPEMFRKIFASVRSQLD